MKSLRLSKLDREKFWSLVRQGDPNACWLWLGGKNGDGYGYFKQRRAHRLAYFLTYGMPRHLVLHSCNNRLCCNPQHLYDGSHRQNMADMTAANHHDGKNRRCEKHPNHKLTTEDVLAIRNSLETGRQLAWHYNISQAAVSMIRNRKRRCYDN